MPTDQPASPTVPARLLVIDDESQIRRFLEISLRAQGYLVMEASNAEEGLALLATHGADAVILDIGLPDRDGHYVLRAIREWSRIPILMLSVRANEEEKVKALDAGANDYVTKPFGVQELMARIRLLLRTAHANATPQSSIFNDGHLLIDLSQRRVELDGHSLALSRKEYALLAYLVRHAGRLITQTQLLNELWGPTHEEDTHYLRILVGKLRQKLADHAAAPRYIITEPGVGLRFIGTSTSTP